ncbi:hypothetical protein ABZX40_22875 [Streptomyces sp. NPDC004610]|uniref:hypothetical protein n=1 Tax=unclassified Streptomyces TaxID=2593676 RepID=UPI0033B81A07
MTPPHPAPLRREQGDIQWTDFGVNVGHTVYGGIHFHPPVLSAGRSLGRDEAARPVRPLRHAAVRSALVDLAHACGRAADALAHLLRPDEAGKEEK